MTRLLVGDAGKSRTDPPLTVTQFVRYQGASGDFNPIHHDTEFARAAGFPSAFAVGMLQFSRLASWLSDWVGVANIQRFTGQFREQAWPGDQLTYSGSVANICGDTAEIQMLVTRQTGGVHIKGSATVTF
jgi:acyl dehydratase